MNEFNENWNWQLGFIEDIKDILRSQAMHIIDIRIATPEEDLKQFTDLKIKVTSGDVAVRIRRDASFRDLTIRAVNKNSKTEIHKLREGYGDWYLYLWTEKNKIVEWILVDINKMRDANLFSEQRKVTMNTDGYTGFITYTIEELEYNNCIIAKNKDICEK